MSQLGTMGIVTELVFQCLRAYRGTMANKPLDIDWRSARFAVENGALYDKVASEFGIGSGTLRKRAQREGWMTPGKVKDAVERHELKQRHGMSRDVALSALAQSWAEKGEGHRSLVFDRASAAMKSAKLEPPKNWRDAEIVDKMARKAAGLESGDTQISVAFVPMQWPKEATETGGFCGAFVDVESAGEGASLGD